MIFLYNALSNLNVAPSFGLLESDNAILMSVFHIVSSNLYINDLELKIKWKHLKLKKKKERKKDSPFVINN